MGKQRQSIDIFHHDKCAIIMLGQEPHVEDLHEVRPAFLILMTLREDAGQHERIAEEGRRGLLGQAALARHLDRDGTHELAAEELVGVEHRAERAAGLHRVEPVLSRDRLAEQSLLQWRVGVHVRSRQLPQPAAPPRAPCWRMRAAEENSLPHPV